MLVGARYARALLLLRGSRRYIVPVGIGTTLNVDLPQPSLTINVEAGDDLERIHIQAFDAEDRLVDTNKVFAVDKAPNSISLRYCEAHGISRTSAQLRSLRLVTPEKWCGLLVKSGSHDVNIESVNEANVNVASDGGSIRLGRLKGNEAFFQTGGGCFSASSLSATCELTTGGGSVYVGKLMGTSVVVATEGGPLGVRSLYADEVRFHTMRGSVDIDYLKATTSALIATGGGNARIKGADGNMTIISSGGNVELQLCDAAEEAVIDTGTGEVLLYLPFGIAAKVEHEGTGRVHFANEAYRECAKSVADSSSRQSSQSGACEVKIRGSGDVLVRRRSWIESLKSRLDHQATFRS